MHPAASRVRKLAESTPAVFLAFDLLERGKADLAVRPLAERRPLLEKFAAKRFSAMNLFRLSPASTKRKDAEHWLASAGAEATA